jgi:hypothetical protein
VFVDESSTNVALTPRYARALRGERARGKAPRNWGKNVTLISSISLEGVGASMSIEGSSDTESFGLYLRELLCPRLKVGQIVVMDNPSVHRSAWVRELIEQEGASVVLLPPLLAGLQPHRRSLLEGEGALEEGGCEDPRRALRGDASGARRGHGRGCTGLLRTLRLPQGQLL